MRVLSTSEIEEVSGGDGPGGLAFAGAAATIAGATILVVAGPAVAAAAAVMTIGGVGLNMLNQYANQSTSQNACR